MRNELAVQTKCVNTLNDMGGHAFKSNNRFKAGILDIHCTIGGESLWIEWKYVRQTKSSFKVKATPKQQQFAKAERAAGGMVYGMLFIQHATERNKFGIALFDPADPQATEGTFVWRKAPAKWSAMLVDYITPIAIGARNDD